MGNDHNLKIATLQGFAILSTPVDVAIVECADLL
jgi:hypothetical protein